MLRYRIGPPVELTMSSVFGISVTVESLGLKKRALVPTPSVVVCVVLRQSLGLAEGSRSATFTPGGWQSVTERAPGAESSVPGQGRQTVFEVAPWVMLYVFAGQRVGTVPPSQ
eukprot:723276-Rhodomonas_salina.1